MAVIRKTLLIVGIGLLVPSALWLIGGLLSLVPTDAAAFAGQSGLRSIGSVAVAGCLLAALGSWQS